jgi:uracil-DNA glycosylase family 4
MRGAPFVGPAGSLLEQFYKSAGLTREDISFLNLVPMELHGSALQEAARSAEMQKELHRSLQRCKGARVIVLCGDVPLRVLLNMQGHEGITAWRGTIFAPALYNQKLQKLCPVQSGLLAVLPVYHPAYTLRMPRTAAAQFRDWSVVAQILKTGRAPEPPQRRHITYPSRAEVEWFMDFVRSFPVSTPLAFDIETIPSLGRIVCIGFAVRTTESLVLDWSVKWQREAARALLQLPNPKLGQNGHYDLFYLYTDEHPTPVRNYWWDTMYLHHQLHTTEPHSLAYLASMYTYTPYYKHEGRASGRGIGDLNVKLAEYCGLDCCVQVEVFNALHAELVAAGPQALRFHKEHYQEMYAPLLDVSLAGLRVDSAFLGNTGAQMEKSLAALRAEIEKDAPVFGKNSISNEKLRTWLYTTHGMPKEWGKESEKTGDKNLSVSEATLRRHMLRDTKKAQRLAPVLERILKFRELHTLSRFFVKKDLIDPDGYVRAQYSLNTEAGRCSSKANPRLRGRNLQNIPPEVRPGFVPDVEIRRGV